MLNVVQKIAEEMVALMAQVMDSDVGVNPKVGKNTLVGSRLRESLASVARVQGDMLVAGVLANHYLDFIESGRRKGAAAPPFSAIAEWCSRKGLPSDNSTVWRIRNAIVRDGIAARPVLSVFFDRVEGMFSETWSDMLFNVITDNLDKYFDS